jgi:hypothetical protein
LLQRHPAEREPRGEHGRPRAEVEQHREVADVVGVVVGDEDPAHVGGVDDGPELLQPCGTVARGPGVDEDGLGGADHG